MEDQLTIFIISDSLGKQPKLLQKRVCHNFQDMMIGIFNVFPILTVRNA